MELSKELMPDGLGLSCIENDCLCIMQQMDMHYQYIFYESYLNFSKIFKEFYQRHVTYEQFHAIERLQMVAEQLGYLKIHYVEEKDINQVFKNNQVCSICIDPKWLLSKFKSTLLREDHYILIEKRSEEEFHFINDTPKAEGIISKEELKENYLQRVVYYEKTEGECNKDRDTIFKEFYQNILKNDDTTLDFQIDDPKQMTLMLRDIIGVLRVIIRRTSKLCREIFDVQFLEDYYEYLSDIYSRIEYFRLRRKYDVNYIKSMIDDIHDADHKNQRKLCAELKKYLKGTIQ